MARIISSACLRVVDAVETEFLGPDHALFHEVRVVVDQPGHDGFAARSMRRVFGPARRAISWVVPTATMRSPLTATACAIEKRSSTVMILPLVRMMSAAACCACARAGTCSVEPPPRRVQSGSVRSGAMPHPFFHGCPLRVGRSFSPRQAGREARLPFNRSSGRFLFRAGRRWRQSIALPYRHRERDDHDERDGDDDVSTRIYSTSSIIAVH